MSVSNADLGLAPLPALGRVARLRDKANLIVIVGSNSFNVLAITAIMPVLSTMGAHFDAAAKTGIVAAVFGSRAGGALIAQAMVTLMGVGIMTGGPVAGWIAERIGYRRLLTIALGIYGVTGSFALYVDDPAILLAGRFVQGFACAAIAIGVFSLIGERFEGQARAKVLGYQGAVVSAVGLLSLLASGQIAEIGGWRAPFALFLTAFLMLALALVSTPAPTTESATKRTEKHAEKTGSLLGLWPLYLMLVPFYLAAYMTTLHLSFVLAGDGVTSPATQSWIMTASFVMNVLTSVYYGRLMNRFGQRSVFVLLLGIFALSDLTIGLVPNATGSTIGCWIAGLAGGLMSPFFTNAILNRAPVEARGRAIGLMYTAMYIGDFINPWIVTPLRDAIGNHAAFAVVGVALTGAAALQAMSRRSPFGTG